MNTFKLDLDINIKYSIEDLANKLYEKLNMNLDEPIENDILSYDGCNIQLFPNMIVVRNNYSYSDKYGKYITIGNSNLLREIEDWTKDEYLNNKNIKKVD